MPRTTKLPTHLSLDAIKKLLQIKKRMAPLEKRKEELEKELAKIESELKTLGSGRMTTKAKRRKKVRRKKAAKKTLRKKTARKVGRKKVARKKTARKAVKKTARKVAAKAVRKVAKKGARKKARKVAGKGKGRAATGKLTLEDVVGGLIKNNKKPLAFQAILKTILGKKLVATKSKNFANVLRRTLSTSKKIKRVGRGMYDVA
jgi:chromosome segregation ATPase